MASAIVCSLTSGLEDIPRNKRGNYLHVLTCLSTLDRVSIFELTYSQTLAKVCDNIRSFGWVEFDNSIQFPWVGVKMTNAGWEAKASMERHNPVEPTKLELSIREPL